MKKSVKRRKKRSKRLFRSFILLLLIAVCAISFCLFSPFFNLAQIEITGNDQLSTEQIEAASGISYGENIFKINKKSVYKNLFKLPEIASVKMRRIPLTKIKLTVKETYPRFIFTAKEGYVVTDENGKAMRLISDVSEEELPLVLGIEAENINISEKISVQDGVKFDIIIENLALLQEKGILEEMSEIDFSDLSSTQGRLKSGAKVIFGKLTDLEYKLSVMLAVLPQIDSSSGAYLDLTTPSNAFYGRIEETKETEPPKEEETPSPTPEALENPQ